LRRARRRGPATVRPRVAPERRRADAIGDATRAQSGRSGETAAMLTTTGRVRISRARWLKAQEHERVFWQRLAAGIAEGAVGQLDWYKWRATQLELLLAAVPDAAVTSGKVLEIGSGPIGIVNFLGWGDRYAIDPLEPFYREQPSLIKLRNADAIYLSGSGEQLPMPDGSVALVIPD